MIFKFLIQKLFVTTVLCGFTAASLPSYTFEIPIDCKVSIGDQKVAKLYSTLGNFLLNRYEKMKKAYPDSELGDRYLRINNELDLALKKPGTEKQKQELAHLASRIIGVVSGVITNTDYVLGSSDDYLIILVLLLAPFKLLNANDPIRQSLLHTLIGMGKIGGDLFNLIDFIADSFLCESGSSLSRNFPQYNEAILRELIESCKFNSCRSLLNQKVSNQFKGADKIFLRKNESESNFNKQGRKVIGIKAKQLADKLRGKGEQLNEEMDKAGKNAKEAIKGKSLKVKSRLENIVPKIQSPDLGSFNFSDKLRSLHSGFSKEVKKVKGKRRSWRQKENFVPS